MSNQVGFTGIAFPFRFSGGGSVAKSTTSVDDFSHIREEIVQILCTNLGERVFKPSFGSELIKATYSDNDITTVSLVKAYVADALKSLEDIIEILDVGIKQGDEDGLIIITVDIFVKKYLKSDSVIIPYKIGLGGAL